VYQHIGKECWNHSLFISTCFYSFNLIYNHFMKIKTKVLVRKDMNVNDHEKQFRIANSDTNILYQVFFHLIFSNGYFGLYPLFHIYFLSISFFPIVNKFP